jgi:hypothetical protein
VLGGRWLRLLEGGGGQAAGCGCWRVEAGRRLGRAAHRRRAGESGGPAGAWPTWGLGKGVGQSGRDRECVTR